MNAREVGPVDEHEWRLAEDRRDAQTDLGLALLFWVTAQPLVLPFFVLWWQGFLFVEFLGALAPAGAALIHRRCLSRFTITAALFPWALVATVSTICVAASLAP